MLVVQELVGARGVEDVKRTLATHVEPLGELSASKDAYSSSLK